jgi:hypothetical protein
LQENPFLVSDVVLKPTETKYHFYLGLKGDVDQTFKYDVNAGFSELRNAQFFKANDLFDYVNTLNRSAYNFANNFSAIYDDVVRANCSRAGTDGHVSCGWCTKNNVPNTFASAAIQQPK